MEQLSLLGKVKARIVGHRIFGNAFLAGEELIKGIWFHLDTARAFSQYRNFSHCKSFEDYYLFSEQNFGPHQIKQEIIGFLEFAAQSSPQYVCEIGTADGGTSFLLSQSLRSVTHMIGVDLLIKNKSKLRYFAKPCQQVTLIRGSSHAKATVNQVENMLAGKQLDLLFIDGDHTYDGVKQDFLSYRHLVKLGGIIAFHDIMPDYMTRYGQTTGRWTGDVPKFWQQVKALYPDHEFVADRNQDGLGIGAIVYDPNVRISEDCL